MEISIVIRAAPSEASAEVEEDDGYLTDRPNVISLDHYRKTRRNPLSIA